MDGALHPTHPTHQCNQQYRHSNQQQDRMMTTLGLPQHQSNSYILTIVLILLQHNIVSVVTITLYNIICTCNAITIQMTSVINKVLDGIPYDACSCTSIVASVVGDLHPRWFIMMDPLVITMVTKHFAHVVQNHT